jgi:hypothetical protein
VDPLAASYPHYTPYSFSGNRVIAHVELEGLEDKNYLNEFLNKAKGLLLNKAKDVAVSYVNTIYNNIKRTTKDYIQSKELVVTANIHARYSVGGRATFETKHLIGADIDLDSVTMLSIDGSINLGTGEFDGTIDYYGKNGEFVWTEKVSSSIPLEGLEIPFQISGGWSEEYIKEKGKNGEFVLDLEKDMKKSIEVGAGFLLLPIGISVSNDVITNEETGKLKTEQNAKLDAGFAGGVGIVGEANVSIEFKIKDKNDEDER